MLDTVQRISTMTLVSRNRNESKPKKTKPRQFELSFGFFSSFITTRQRDQVHEPLETRLYAYTWKELFTS